MTIPDPVAAKGLLSTVRDLVWHARLRLRFDPSLTFDVAGHGDHPGQRARYVHVICVNVSWLVEACGCCPYLQGVASRRPDGSLASLRDFHGPVPLHWANTPDNGPSAYPPDQIEPRTHRRIDVGYTVEGDTTFHLYLPPAWVGVRRHLEPGDYMLNILVRSQNTVPKRVRRSFNLTIGTNWAQTQLAETG